MNDIKAADEPRSQQDRHRPPASFSHQLTRLVLLSVLPFMLLALGLSISTAVQQRNQTIAELITTAESLQIAVDRELRLALSTLEVLETSPALDPVLDAAPDDVAALTPFYIQARAVAGRQSDIILNIVLMDTEGWQIVNTHRALGEALPGPGRIEMPAGRMPGSGALDPDAVVAEVVATGRPYVTDLVIGAVTQRPIVAVMLPVVREGEVRGVLTANLLPETIGQAMNAQMPPIGYVAALVDRAGIIVARTSETERFVGEAATDEVRAYQAGADPAPRSQYSLTADGQQVYGAFARLETVPWALAYGAPRALVDAPIRRLVLIVGVAGSLALLLFVAATLSIGPSLAREMKTLANDAERIGRGEALPARHERVREVAEVRAALRAGVASLAEAEERMRLAADGSGMATWEIDVARRQVLWSGHFAEMLGLPGDSPSPLPIEAWRDRIHAGDLPRMLDDWKRSAAEDGRFHAVYRIERPDGTQRWLESFGSHIRDGRHHRFIGVTFDVTDRHRADEQHRLLMREVDHRAKNALAVVHSVVRLTRASDVASYAAAVEGRVRALARAHDLLARDRWAGAGLHEIAGLELAAQIAGGQATLHGRPVRIEPEAVQPLSMVLHELTTNAIKYGALSAPEGRVRLSWRLCGRGGPLALRWTETGGPAAAAPGGRGFGTRLLDVTVKAQLDGNVRFDWRPEGLRCTVLLARDRVGDAGAVGEAPAGEKRGEAGPEAEEPALAGSRVLVVEDEAVIGAELVLTLRRARCRPVGPHPDPAQALVAIEVAPRLDAALIDVNLAGESSLPVARALARRGVPVVVVTGYSELPAEWSRETGIVAILRKPADPGELLAALGRAVRARRAAA